MSRRLVFLSAAMVVMACSQRGPSQQRDVGPSDTNKMVVSRPPDRTGWRIFDRDIKQVGIVTTRLGPQGVLVTLDTMGLPPGEHGVHIHQVPKCEAPDFASAGGHWNWTEKKHGHQNPKGHHAGDLGNLSVGPDGKGEATFTVPLKDWDPKLSGGLPIIIHAKADDDKTDPSGNSGERIACGVLYLRRE